MILADGALGLVLLALWLFCIIDVITTPEQQMRNLPKAIWVLLVLILFDLGAIIWLVAGRNWNKPKRAPRSAQRVPSNPDDDEDFLRQMKARVEEQRRSYEAKRKQEEDGGE